MLASEVSFLLNSVWPRGASKAVCGACNGGTKIACDDCNRHILCGCRVWCQVPNSHLSTKVKCGRKGFHPTWNLCHREFCNAVLGTRSAALQVG